ncbi:MAG: radical SAM protein [Bacteroidales bacterium]|nr:radical SAM protein [Bacteroidales bacterium]
MTIIIKPTFNCNFRCSYCYLTNAVKSSKIMMKYEIAERLILQATKLCREQCKKTLTLIWHGGEPLLWGIDNYRRIFDFAEKHSNGVRIKQCLQTNLSLIDAEYIKLFKEHNVKVGFSLDGTKPINDLQRKTIEGKGTFNIIMDKVAMCRTANLDIGCILVGSKNFKGHIVEVYDFLCANNLNFKFNPLFNVGEALNARSNLEISPKEYAEMSIELFDLWYYDKIHSLKESTFIDIASYFMSISKKTKGCMFAPNCQDSFMAVSPSGDIFPCGRFCETDTSYSYGNISDDSLENIILNIKKSEIYARGQFMKDSSCAKCKFFKLCHGGCLHDGFLKSRDFKSKTFLCSAYKRIFNHIEQRVSSFIN